MQPRVGMVYRQIRLQGHWLRLHDFLADLGCSDVICLANEVLLPSMVIQCILTDLQYVRSVVQTKSICDGLDSIYILNRLPLRKSCETIIFEEIFVARTLLMASCFLQIVLPNSAIGMGIPKTAPKAMQGSDMSDEKFCAYVQY